MHIQLEIERFRADGKIFYLLLIKRFIKLW